MLGEPVALPGREVTASYGAGRYRVHLEAAGAPDVAGRLIAAVKHGFLELRRPAQQHAPAALRARPFFEARLLGPCSCRGAGFRGRGGRPGPGPDIIQP